MGVREKVRWTERWSERRGERQVERLARVDISEECRVHDGELSQHKNTRVPSEPTYELRKRNHSQQQQNNILLLIHKFEKLSIHEMNEEDLYKTLKESVDPKGIILPSLPFIY